MNTKLIFGLLCCALQVQIHAMNEQPRTKKEVKQLQAEKRVCVLNGHINPRPTQNVQLTDEQKKLYKLRQMNRSNGQLNRSKL